ncbi:MAG: type III pantothenate kinase, partial [Desulfobulbaceae bacterium]|nr:type III pantothenate kinase [Desulfobulbaceae bacterium]
MQKTKNRSSNSDPTSLLAIDVGNSHTVIGIFFKDKLRSQWHIKTDRDMTADELAGMCHTLFLMEGLGLHDISNAVIASVVPSMESEWAAFSRKHLEITPLLISGTDLETGIQIKTDHPEEVGADRIANAVAAYHHHGTALIVVDFGTAITFDCISAKGEYLGGAIAPGLGISMDALFERTAKLPRVNISEPPEGPIGTNTITAIKSGFLFGFGGLVEGLVKRIKKEFEPETPKVIATGGMAAIVAPYAESIESVEPELTLE